MSATETRAEATETSAPATTPAPTRPAPSGFWKRLLRRPIAVVCLAYLALVVVVAIVAPFALPDVGSQRAGDLADALLGPGGGHPLGTDSLGRDVLERLLVGTRVTLIGVAQALVVVVAVGVPMGLLAGYFRGRLDRVVTWLADLTFSMPAIVIVLVVLGIFRGSMTAAMVTFGLIASPAMMRVVRSATLSVREELYIAAARVSGLSHPYIIVRHVLPRVSGAAIIQASLISASALLAQSGLAFLGLIVTAPAPSWGGMIANGVEEMLTQPWLIWPPGLAITFTILALGLLGDALRDANAEAWAPAAKKRKRRRPVAASAPAPVKPSAAVVDEPRRTVTDGPQPLLAIDGLTVTLTTANGTDPVVQGVSFSIAEGETLGLVGESGCGKTMTAMSLMGLLPAAAQIEAGGIRFDGRELVGRTEAEMRRIRGSEIGLIAQEPMISLNPAFRIGWQLAEVVRRHHPGMSRSDARERAVELLRQVHMPNPEAAARKYPHEMSGGQAQRVAIARSLAGEPKLLIADEPTTALDVTVQAEILQLLRDLQAERNMAILIVTHDWGVVADMADRAIVMYAGQIVEQAPLLEMFRAPAHPYTRALIASNPQNATGEERLPAIAGSVPMLGQWPAGCRFHPRCERATAACSVSAIDLRVDGDRETRCIHHEEAARA